MAKGFEAVVLRGLGAKEHAVTVIGKRRLAPHFIRVTCRSEGLLDPKGEAPANWLRLWFPDPDGGPKEFQRGYTLVDPDPATGEFSIDFVIHEPAGPASHWAVNCEEGDRIVAMRYGEQPFAPPEPPPAGYLLLGDLAGYPAIRALVAAIPEESPVVVYLERHSPDDDHIALPEGPNITASWVDELPDGQALVQAISDGDWAGWYAWVTAETASTRHAKTLLQRKFGLNRATLHAHAYWVRGRQMGKTQTIDSAGPEAPAAKGASAAPAASAASAASAESATVGESRASAGPNGAGGSGNVGGAAAAAADGAGSDVNATATASDASEDGVLRPLKRPLIAAGIVEGALSLLQLIPFILFAELARLFVGGAPAEAFARPAIWAVVAMAISAVGTSLLVLWLHHLDANFATALRHRLMAKFSRLPLGWFMRGRAADVKKIAGDDVRSLHYLVTHAVPDIVGAVVAALGSLIYLFAVQWRLGLVLLLPIVAYIYVLKGIQRRDKEKVLQNQRYEVLAAGQTQAFIGSRGTSAVFGPKAVVDLEGTLRESGDFMADWQRDTGPRKIIAVMTNRPTTVLGVLLVAGFAMVVAGWMPATDLIPFLILGTSFGGRLLNLGLGAASLSGGLEAKAGVELFLATPELAPPVDRPAPPGHVRFDHVDFSYGGGRKVIDDLSLTLEPGSVTALVGPSGAGKSTVAALLARLWDVTGGSVSIDGVDVRDLTQEQLYSSVSVLLQDAQLVHASIRDNIALNRPEATDAQIREAAEAADVHRVIEALPDGYDTVVEPNRLSGGERQRVASARALLANTPIVVLDEATAAADPDSEAAIHRGLERLLAGKTVLMIAHRLHTIRNASRILVLDEGKVVEEGTHSRLVAAGGAYRRMWDAHCGAPVAVAVESEEN
ncbi:ABC transporter ATP-binding protein/permease [Corynebacterium hansenii]|uniref:Mycobactin import ATP-binding/permease protein IrtA n=1 Tax=Corynebacterium hansenii TaxID=394964 RepID=A0ABV7ZRI8_9CORY|nr:ATP-binding cassette domain-containing protein [Corynebacterium hansenii]WJZ00591.1 Iron import ATP-binding/permease protein IrtA [Corynebacterium hansenii]